MLHFLHPNEKSVKSNNNQKLKGTFEKCTEEKGCFGPTYNCDCVMNETEQIVFKETGGGKL